MAIVHDDRVFAGSIPQLYERYLVPLNFEPYARDMAGRLAALAPRRILEIAAGTGVLTRAMASALEYGASIDATDLNGPMIAQARALGTARPVAWREADALALPFADGTFDAVACQFGVMFFPDRPRAFSEARRVLKPGGRFLFSVWDRIEENEFADVVTRALAQLFPADPPRFLARTPHGYHDADAIRSDLARGGFTSGVQVATVAARSRAEACAAPAIAYCQGPPLRNEIEARDPARLAEATDAAAAAIAARFGRGTVDGKIQAHVVAVGR